MQVEFTLDFFLVSHVTAGHSDETTILMASKRNIIFAINLIFFIIKNSILNILLK